MSRKVGKRDDITWVRLSEIREALSSHPNVGSNVGLSLETLAGHNLLKIKVRSARLSGRENEDIKNWTVEKEFLTADGARRSQANISVLDDTLNASIYRYGRNDRLTRLDCVGLSFDKSDLGSAFPGMLAELPKATSQMPRIEAAALSRMGRHPDKKSWTQFGAALATVAACDDDGIEIGQSAASIYEKIGKVLQHRLGPDAKYMTIDNVRDTITLAQEWINIGMHHSVD